MWDTDIVSSLNSKILSLTYGIVYVCYGDITVYKKHNGEKIDTINTNMGGVSKILKIDGFHCVIGFDRGLACIKVSDGEVNVLKFIDTKNPIDNLEKADDWNNVVYTCGDKLFMFNIYS